MKKGSSPKAPTQPTVKRLFAVSGNLCAFPKCSTPLIDLQSGSVIGEICHIKGAKPDSARYDGNQLDKDRHSFENLLLLCNVHHKIADDDEIAYTVERLRTMKQEHETRHTVAPSVEKATVGKFVKVAIENSKIGGSVVASHGQTGGQTAHSITNNYVSPMLADDEIKLECKIDIAADLEVVAAIGCPGMRFTVICRSRRPAKIKYAYLLIDDVDVMEGLRKGFEAEMKYTPLEGSTQLAHVELARLSKPNSQEGYVLNRDDVVRFFFPLPTPATTLALRAKSENVSVSVEFFDGSEQTLMKGEEIQPVLSELFRLYHERAGEYRGILRFGVTVKSTTRLEPSDLALMGQVNKNPVEIAKSDGEKTGDVR